MAEVSEVPHRPVAQEKGWWSKVPAPAAHLLPPGLEGQDAPGPGVRSYGKKLQYLFGIETTGNVGRTCASFCGAPGSPRYLGGFAAAPKSLGCCSVLNLKLLQSPKCHLLMPFFPPRDLVFFECFWSELLEELRPPPAEWRPLQVRLQLSPAMAEVSEVPHRPVAQEKGWWSKVPAPAAHLLPPGLEGQDAPGPGVRSYGKKLQYLFGIETTGNVGRTCASFCGAPGSPRYLGGFAAAPKSLGCCSVLNLKLLQSPKCHLLMPFFPPRDLVFFECFWSELLEELRPPPAEWRPLQVRLQLRREKQGQCQRVQILAASFPVQKTPRIQKPNRGDVFLAMSQHHNGVIGIFFSGPAVAPPILSLISKKVFTTTTWALWASWNSGWFWRAYLSKPKGVFKKTTKRKTCFWVVSCCRSLSSL